LIDAADTQAAVITVYGMNRTGRLVLLLCLLCLCFSAAPVFGQDAAGSDETPGTDTREPEPYRDEEFADWLHDLRRFEIITFGSLPFTFLVSFLVYDFIRYASNGFDGDYALIGSTNPVPYSREETVGVVVAACSASVLIALVDLIIGTARRGSVENGNS